ncbi:YebC/PmpR family DNA-binding transcriptional regulator [Rhodohalobacter sp. SW132]|uniref:YebC/PmpR family DNA-binding transcriptional regulator n=1 Tax=Rhodohalobacter sp. SW132 TaxID=2293433 RepID=UPI000E26E118|nr:YebC/PmpR family DNA-binding transcriptional regulator [Rhodohalobacter sp. SW132]REL25050.1 YebC/PmpR family DNA-binding transcriptional regulator [Rhodohalobacter sp. SW132]
MAGHSKWANIKHKKAKEDAKRAKAFTKHIREITVAARVGGGDPDANPRLSLAIENAKKVNLPKDNIERAIKKGTGELDDGSGNYEEVTYEGYGPGGIAYFIEATSNNLNRTVGEIRHIFTKHGGNLGTDGSVAYMFDQKGSIKIEGSDLEDDELMLIAIEAGAEDVINQGEFIEVITAREDLFEVSNNLENEGVEVESANLIRIPATEVEADPDTAKTNLKMMDMFDENDDVSEIFTNMKMDEQTLALAED